MNRQNATYLVFSGLQECTTSTLHRLTERRPVRLLVSWNQPKRDRDQHKWFQANILHIDIGVHRYPIMSRLSSIHS